MVWRDDAQPLEHEAGFEWIIGRIGFRDGSRLRCFCHWLPDPGVHLFAFEPLRNHGAAPDFWSGSPHRGDGALLDDGQTRTDLPRGGRYSHSAERDIRA